MNIFKSRAAEPKPSTWKTLAQRWLESGVKKQEVWMDDCLKRAGYDPDAWMKTGEMPSELLCRYASESGKNIDAFLLDVMKRTG